MFWGQTVLQGDPIRVTDDRAQPVTHRSIAYPKALFSLPHRKSQCGVACRQAMLFSAHRDVAAC